MKKFGIYLQGFEQKMDKDVLVKHTIVQLSVPNERGYCDDPVVRSTYLDKGVLDILPSGTPIAFDIDIKQRRLDNGTKVEKIVPVEIRPLTEVEIAEITKYFPMISVNQASPAPEQANSVPEQASSTPEQASSTPEQANATDKKAVKSK